MANSDDDFDEFLKYLYETHIITSALAFREHWFHDQLNAVLADLQQAKALAPILNSRAARRSEESDQIVRVVTGQASLAVTSALQFHNRLLEDTGFAEVLDKYFDVIAANVQPRNLPDTEAELLRAAGFPEVAEHIAGLLYIARLNARSSHERPVSDQLVAAPATVSATAEPQAATAEPQAVPSPQGSGRGPGRAPRRWFKGIGQIVQGTALSLTNMAVAIGGLELSVPPETRAFGSVASTTAGVALILGGVGDLRGE